MKKIILPKLNFRNLKSPSKRSPRTPSPRITSSVSDNQLGKIDKKTLKNWRSLSLDNLNEVLITSHVEPECLECMQDKNYLRKWVCPEWLIGSEIIYIEFIHKKYPQLFEVYDNKNHFYLVRWAGPFPTEIYDGKHLFDRLWDEFVFRFYPEKKKRVLVSPEEKRMKKFLKTLPYVSLVGRDKYYDVYRINIPRV